MTDTPRTDAERLADLAQKMREREQEHRKFLGFPCQSESAWHADEIGGWADELEALLRARRGGAPQDELVDRLQRDKRILELSIPLEDDLSARIDEMCKYLAMEDGFTLNGIARLFIDCQRRMAADWLEIGKLRREAKSREPSPAHGAAPPQEPDTVTNG